MGEPTQPPCPECEKLRESLEDLEKENAELTSKIEKLRHLLLDIFEGMRPCEDEKYSYRFDMALTERNAAIEKIKSV